MNHSLLSVIAPLAFDRVEAVRSRIEAQMGNPASQDIRDALVPIRGDNEVHFMSLHAIAGSDERRGSIFLEITADGSEDDVLAHIARALAPQLTAVFEHAKDWRDGMNLQDYLRRHIVTPSQGLTGSPGLNFVGTPEMSVGRIKKEAALRRYLVGTLARLPAGHTPMQNVRALRAAVANDAAFSWALMPPPPISRAGKQKLVGLKQITTLLIAAIRSFLWPLLLLLLAWMGITALQEQSWRAAQTAAMTVFGKGAVAIIIFAALSLAFIYVRLLAQEKTDWVSDRTPSVSERAAMRQRENKGVQNHMISITVRKPGFIRLCTSRLAFFLVGNLSSMTGNPGFLSNIGTIHFARWITIPGTRTLFSCPTTMAAGRAISRISLLKRMRGCRQSGQTRSDFRAREGLSKKGQQTANGSSGLRATA